MTTHVPDPRQQGASMIEMMVAMTVALVIFGGAFGVAIADSKVYRSQTNVSEMRANARNGLEFMTRDIRQAGYGLSQLPSTIPVLIANEPTNLTTASSIAITTRFNSLDVSTSLSDSMPDTSSELKVTSTSGFVEGMRVMIWDNTGTFDWLDITQVQVSPDHLQHNTTNCSKSYRPEDNTVIAAIDEVSYRFVAANRQIERLQNNKSWYVIANNVELLSIRYWDDSNTEIFPADETARRSIRRVAVLVRVRTSEKDRVTGKFKTYTARTEIAPRNLPFLPS